MRRAARGAYDTKTDMNNVPNTLATLAPVNATANPSAAGASAAPAAGEAGAFAQVLGTAVSNITDNTTNTTAAAALPEAVIGAAVPAATAVALPQDAPAPEAAPQELTMAPPDAALIASLLGQMQAPYAALVPAAPAPAPEPHPTALPAAQTLSSVPAMPVTSAVPESGTILAEQPTPAPRDPAAAAALPPAASDVAAPAQDRDPDRHAGNTPPETVRAPAEPRAAPQAAVARDLPAALAASAARISTAAANANAPLRDAPARPANDVVADEGAHATAAARDMMHSAISDEAVHPAHLPTYADLKRALETPSVNREQEAATVAVAAPAMAAALSTQPRAGAFKAAHDFNAELPAIVATTPAAIASRVDAPPPIVNIAPHMDTPAWQPAFAGNVKLLVQEGTSAATLQLNPAEFGPIDVRIVVTDQRADIAFTVTHPDANAAIQSSLSELREQLARSGIQLGQTSVGAHPQQPRQPPAPPRRETASPPDVSAAAATLPPGRSRGLGHGSIDIYA